MERVGAATTSNTNPTAPGTIGYAVTEAKRCIKMHGDLFSDLGTPSDARRRRRRSIRLAPRQIFLQCHPDKNEGKRETVPANYSQSLTVLNAQLCILAAVLH